MLRLTPYNLSYIFSEQLLQESSHLSTYFKNKFIPLYDQRLLCKEFQREGSGSIGIGSALCLFLVSYKIKPKNIIEVGTYIGNSALAMALGASMHDKEVKVFTCDKNPCTDKPLDGIDMPKGSSCTVFKGLSTAMFESLATQNIKIDILHIDGRLLDKDIELLRRLISSDTLIALDELSQ